MKYIIALLLLLAAAPALAQETTVGGGSGGVLWSDGATSLVLTAHHAVKGRGLQIVWRDREKDLAVVRRAARATDNQTVKLLAPGEGRAYGDKTLLRGRHGNLDDVQFARGSFVATSDSSMIDFEARAGDSGSVLVCQYGILIGVLTRKDFRGDRAGTVVQHCNHAELQRIVRRYGGVERQVRR